GAVRVAEPRDGRGGDLDAAAGGLQRVGVRVRAEVGEQRVVPAAGWEAQFAGGPELVERRRVAPPGVEVLQPLPSRAAFGELRSGAVRVAEPRDGRGGDLDAAAGGLQRVGVRVRAEVGEQRVVPAAGWEAQFAGGPELVERRRVAPPGVEVLQPLPSRAAFGEL